jgi:tRNA-uridine 2-sulfurtransferase
MNRMAVILVSGGLDSLLAVRLLVDQGIDVLGLNFVSPFFSCSGAGGRHLPSKALEEMGVKLRVVAMGRDYIDLLRRPRHGRGREMNPCVDCHIFMLRRAARLADDVGAAFVATGEVLGQRPLSQHKQALELIERQSGLSGRLLRPLSARLLKPTIPEMEGIVDRSRLGDIQGRSRRQQLALAEQMNLATFSPPAGGCLLTDPNVSSRLRDLFAHLPDYDMLDMRLLVLGRHFRLNAGLKAIVGRNQQENEKLARLADRHEILELRDHPGPLMLVRGRPAVEELAKLGRMLRYYVKKETGPRVVLSRIHDGREEALIIEGQATREEVERLRI